MSQKTETRLGKPRGCATCKHFLAEEHGICYPCTPVNDWMNWTPRPSWGVAQELADEPILDAAQQKAEPGWKHDGGKPRLDLIAPEMLFGLGQVLAFGAAKYAERNWEKGMSWGRCFGALMRHMWAWWRGEANDPETGFSHLWHAACCLMFLIAYEERSVGTDDRKVT